MKIPKNNDGNKEKNIKIKKNSIKIGNVGQTTKNTLKSIKDIVASDLSASMPFLSSVKTDVKEIVSDATSKIRSNETDKSFKKFNAMNFVNKNLSELSKNFMRDITTGKWVNDEDVFDELGFDDVDGFDSDDGYDTDNLSDGDTFVAEANARSNKVLGNTISDAIATSTHASIEANKEITMKSTKFTVSSMNAGFGALNSSLANLVNFSATATTDHYNNAATYYTTMMENSATMITLLEDIKDGVGVGTESDDEENLTSFRKLFGSSGRDFNIREFGKLLSTQSIEDVKAFSEPILEEIRDFVKNPMKSITSNLFKRYSIRTRDALEGLDTGIQDLLVNSVSKLFKSDTVSALTSVSLSTAKQITSSNYFKGELKWNGYAQKSLMDVIPGYLSRIEAFLTKSPAIVFDYENGKWIEKATIDKEFKQMIKNEASGATEPLIESLKEIIDTKKLTKKEREGLDKAVESLQFQLMQSAMSGKNVFNQIARNKIITDSDVLNGALKVLFKDNGIYKMDPKKKNELAANLIRSANDLSDKFKDISTKNQSIFHLKDMESEIDYILKNRKLINYLDANDSNNVSNNSDNNTPNTSRRRSRGFNIRNRNIETANFVTAARRVADESDARYGDEYLNNKLESLDREYNDIKDKDIIDKDTKAVTDHKKYFIKKYKKTLEKFVNYYNADNWFRFYKEFVNDKIKREEFDKLWANNNFRISSAIDLLLITGKTDQLYRMYDRKGGNIDILKNLINDFKKINKYKTRTTEEIMSDDSYVQVETSSLYGMTQNEFKESKLKGRRELLKLRQEELDDHIRDAYDLSFDRYDNEGNLNILKSMNSLLSIPDKLMYGMFKKVDKYVFNTLFDNGKFFGDESYKGLIPTIKDQVVEQMKEFGRDLEREVINPLARAANDPENATVFNKIINKLGISGNIEEVKKNIGRYFNGERDENGNLIQVGLKHELIDSIKNDARSVFNLGTETFTQMFGLANRFDGSYAEGGVISEDDNKSKRGKYDEYNEPYEQEKSALTRFIARNIWDSDGELQSFAEGGNVEPRNSAPTVDEVSQNMTEAVKTRVLSSRDGGVVITAQSGETVLTQEQTKDLIRRLKAHIKNGTASPEDISLARSLGITAKLSSVRRGAIDFINRTINRRSGTEDDEGSIARNAVSEVTDTLKGVITQTTESLFNVNAGEALSKSRELITLFGKEGSKDVAGVLSGGAIGGVLGILTGLNPLFALSLGAGISVASKSTKVQEALFGNEEKNGLMNKDIGEYIKNKLPKTLMGAGIGAVGLGMIGPFGIIPNMLIGGTLAHLTQDEKFRHKLWGTSDPEKIMARKEKMKKLIPSALIGAGAMSFMGPFGFLGNMLLGSTVGAGMGILGTSDKFQKAIFGEKASDGKYYGGLLPTFREVVLEPMANHLKDVFSDTKKWFKDAIYSGLKRAFDPLGKFFKGLFKRGGKALGRGVKKLAKLAGNTKIGRGIKRGARKFAEGALTVAGLPGKAFRGITGGLARGMGWLGDNVTTRALLETGIGADQYTAEERAELLERINNSKSTRKPINDYLGMYTDILNQEGIQGDLDAQSQFRDAVRFIRHSADGDQREIDKNNLIKNSGDELKKYSIRNLDGLDKDKDADRIKSIKDNEKELRKLLSKKDFEGAIKFLENDTIFKEDVRADLLNNFRKNSKEYKEIDNRNLGYNEIVEKAREMGLGDNIINDLISVDKKGRTKLNSRIYAVEDYISHNINKSQSLINSYDEMTREGRKKLGDNNRLKSVDDIIEELSSTNQYSNLQSLQKAIMGFHMSGDDINSLLADGLDGSDIKGYNSYQMLKGLGVNDELLNSFSEKDKIALSRSIKASLSMMDENEDVGLSDLFKFTESGLNNNDENGAPKELVNIEKLLVKYMPVLAAATGLTDGKEIQEDLENSNIVNIDTIRKAKQRVNEDTTSNDDVIEKVSEATTANTNNIISEVSSTIQDVADSEDEEDDVLKEVNIMPDGKKQVRDSKGNLKFDVSDRYTRQVLEEENEEKTLRHNFYKTFMGLTRSTDGPGSKEENKGPDILGSLFSGIKNGISSLFGGFGGGKFSLGNLGKGALGLFAPFLLQNAMGESTGSVMGDWAKTSWDTIKGTGKMLFGFGADEEYGITRSDEEDELAKENRTPLQNVFNNTFGKMFGKSGYMGEKDFLQDMAMDVGRFNLRGVDNFLTKNAAGRAARKAAKAQALADGLVGREKRSFIKAAVKNAKKGVSTNPLKNLGSTVKSLFTENMVDGKFVKPEIVDNADSIIGKAKKFFSGKIGRTVTDAGENVARQVVNATESAADKGIINKFNKLIDNLYSALNKIPDFGEVFANSKFVDTIMSFCESKAVLNKIPFDKIARAIGKGVTKLTKKCAASVDNLIKGGAKVIAKFMGKTVANTAKSGAKMIPYIGVVLIVADVVNGIINYKDILGISSSSDITLFQEICYRILGGVAYALLNLPFIWVASLLTSEEFLMDIILEIGDVILPGTSKLSELRKSAKEELAEVNKELKAQGKDELGSITQLNEYNKRNNKNKESSIWKGIKNTWNKFIGKDTEDDNTNKKPAKRSVPSSYLSKIDVKDSQTIDNLINVNKGIKVGSVTNITSQDVGVGGVDVPKSQLDYVGRYVKQFESGNSGSSTISSGEGDHGGVSYGTFQFASNSKKEQNIGGSAKEFWNTYYQSKNRGVPLINNNAFKNAWLGEVSKDPDEFLKNEHTHIMNGYYKKTLENYPGLSEYIRSRAMQESILSTSVQYGVGGATKIFKNALSSLSPTDSQDKIIEAIQNYKNSNVDKNFKSSSQSVRNGVRNRIKREKDVLLPLTSMPVSNTDKITGSLSNVKFENTGADPSNLDGEGNTNVMPSNKYLQFLSSINNITGKIANLFSANKEGSNEETANSFGSSSAEGLINGVQVGVGNTIANLTGNTPADDHFGYKVTAPYAENRGSYAHAGIDYGMPTGTNVVTPVNGKVEINKTNPGGFGEYVGIRDDNNMLHIFGHLSDRNVVKKGQNVSAGQVVGISGNTGASTGPHLHYEVTNTLGSGRKSQDPNLYLQAYANSKSVDTYNKTETKNNSTPENSTSGTGGKALPPSKVVDNNAKMVELLTKVVELLTINNTNTSLIGTVVNLLKSVVNGDIKAVNEDGKNQINNVKNTVKELNKDESLGSEVKSVLNQLEAFATV